MPSETPIVLTRTDAVATITIDRQHRRNALDITALEALDTTVRTAVDGGARAVVLTGAGGHFCAGADLTELEGLDFVRRLTEVLDHLATLPLTTVAAIAGTCMGLGMQLAVACDLRVVDSPAHFAIPVSRLGLMVDLWTIDRVRRLFGEGAMRDMMLTGTVLDADDAWRLGFAQRRGDLAVAEEVAARAARLAPLSQSGSKIGFDAVTDADEDRYRQAFERAWTSADLAEGQAAFRERRSPHFEGR